MQSQTIHGAWISWRGRIGKAQTIDPDLAKNSRFINILFLHYLRLSLGHTLCKLNLGVFTIDNKMLHKYCPLRESYMASPWK